MAVLGGSLGLIGTSLAAAEQVKQGQQMEHPSRTEYEYLICGGGVAAQEALKTFVNHKQAHDLLLVAPEWRNHHVLPTTGCAEVIDEPSMEDNLISAVLKRIALISSTPKKPELLIGPSVKSINATNRTAILDNGDQIAFRRCLIAVGSTMPDIPVGKVVARDAEGLVSGAQSVCDWGRIDQVFQQNARLQRTGEVNRAHMTVVGGGWMSPIVGAFLIEQGADVTFSYSEPSFLARYLPRYVSQDILARLNWQSDGGIDSLSYSTVRYVVARKAIANAFDGIEAEVHVGTVFDSFSIVDFRTDHVIFAPTVTSNIPIEAPNLSRGAGGFTVNAELAVASDIYVAGSAVELSPSTRQSHVMRWSSDYARLTGRHAALNMMGGREPFTPSPVTTVDLRLVNLQVHVLANVDGSHESFGYFRRTKDKGEDTCGGQLEIGAVIYITPAPLSHRGATQKLRITGIAIWEGSLSVKINDVEAAKMEATKLLNLEPMSRPELEQVMDNFAANQLGISLPGKEQKREEASHRTKEGEAHHEADERQEERQARDSLAKVQHSPVYARSSGILWRRHKPARTIRIGENELLWVENETVGAVSPQTKGDRMSQAYSELLRKSAGRT
ncbi:FAD/NAD(P)-binding [Gracilaria domingensis]|nr:FAD/NAD(P)-binding [Gracilaria domingensis]